MKLTDMVISAIIKKGILGEARNVDVTFDIPSETEGLKGMRINVKAEHVSVRIEKD